jgi:RNA polymerase sigma factor (sigma-70 family)
VELHQSHARVSSPKDELSLAASVALMERARRGDDEALEELLRRYLPRVRRWITGRLPHSCRALSDTDDLVQDTLMRVVRGLPGVEFSHEGALQAYLRVAIWNRLREEIRRVRGRPTNVALDESHAAEDASPLEGVIGRDATERYEAGLLRLDEDERSAIIGRLEFGYSYPELAVMLGRRTPDAARKLVARAIPRLAELMRGCR